MTDDGHSDDGERPARRVRSVDRAVDLLEALANGPTVGLGVSELARQAGLSKPTTHHLMMTLEARRLVRRDRQGATYQLGWALHELGTVVVQSADVARAARPYLDELALRSGESVLLGVMVGRSVHYVERGDARIGFTMSATAGMRSLLHTNASGKVLLAYSDAQLIDQYLSETLEAFTPQTITDPTVMRCALETIRADGFATCWQEREQGLCSVAVGVRGHSGRLVAALTVAGPAGRVTPEVVPRHVAALRTAAAEIELQLGAPLLNTDSSSIRPDLTGGQP